MRFEKRLALVATVVLLVAGSLTAQEDSKKQASKSAPKGAASTIPKAAAKAPVKAAAKAPAKAAAKATAGTPAKAAARATPLKAAGKAKSGNGRTTAANKGKAAKATPRYYAQVQPTPERYKEIQQALADKGYFHGPVDGNWGADSADAMKRFQTEQNLDADGKISALALIALGLGPRRGSGAAKGPGDDSGKPPAVAVEAPEAPVTAVPAPGGVTSNPVLDGVAITPETTAHPQQ